MESKKPTIFDHKVSSAINPVDNPALRVDGGGRTVQQQQLLLYMWAKVLSSYRVIKSNCNKQYLSDEPKKCKKWPDPVVFRKLFCGGFGILMSQYDRVEKI